MQAIVIMIVIGLIILWAWLVADYYSQNPPKESLCTSECNQGRTCTCGWPGTTETCTKSCKIETVDKNWPFPHP